MEQDDRRHKILPFFGIKSNHDYRAKKANQDALPKTIEHSFMQSFRDFEQDAPGEIFQYRHWAAVHKRYRCWVKQGIWTQLWAHPRSHIKTKKGMMDASPIKVHQLAAGAEGGTYKRWEKYKNPRYG